MVEGRQDSRRVSAMAVLLLTVILTGCGDDQGTDPKLEDINPTPGDMVLIPAGTFTMGDGEASCGEDEREVTLTRDFYIGVYEVTNGEYVEMLQWAYNQNLVEVDSSGQVLDVTSGKLLGYWLSEYYAIQFSEIKFDREMEVFRLQESSFARENAYPSGYDPTNHPLLMVTWYGAAKYCDWLSESEGYAPAYDDSILNCNGGDPYGAEGYRLPTDAEWEYVTQCQGSRRWPWGEEEPDCERANGIVGSEWCVEWTEPVGSYAAAPAGVGVYDLAGNVLEWCNDLHECDLGNEAQTDPVGPELGSSLRRVLRGGSWGYCDVGCATRCLYYGHARPPYLHTFTGFRLARTVSR